MRYLDVEYFARDSWIDNMFKSPQGFISSLLVAPLPLFPWYWPTPPMDFSPYPWIFLHKTSNTSRVQQL